MTNTDTEILAFLEALVLEKGVVEFIHYGSCTSEGRINMNISEGEDEAYAPTVRQCIEGMIYRSKTDPESQTK